MRCRGVLLSCLILGACAQESEQASVVNAWSSSVPATHRVSSGETLYSIAWEYDMDVKTLAAMNHLKKPYHLYPGHQLFLKQVSLIPSADLKPEPEAPQKKTVQKNFAKVAVTWHRPTSSKNQRYRQTIFSNPSLTSSKSWIWPSKGLIIKAYGRNGNKGIDIAGSYGEPIMAAKAGKIVYSGSGLPGYGNLILINHGGNYLSAYAHNRRVLVHEGDWIKLGEKIAEMGSTGTNRVQLHFEVRRNGMPVNPMQYLPRR